MPESNQPSESLHKDSTRIVYHAQNRTFARLFKERSLDQLKDVVRRKLGLGQESDVSLKQMGSDTLLDLEDDDDFQAFCVLLKSSASVDVQVTVSKSRDIPVLSPAALELQEQPSVTEPPVPSRSSQPKGSGGQTGVHPGVASATEPPTETKKAADPTTRKRKVSFDDTAAAASDVRAERHAKSKSVVSSPVSSAKPVKTSVIPKPMDVEEPPKKKTKRVKDVQPSDVVEIASTEASSAAKPKVKKSGASGRGNEAGPSAPASGEPSEKPTKKSKKPKKGDITASEKSSTSVNPDGVNQPISHSSPMNNTSLRSASERHGSSVVEGSTPKICQSEKKIGACAAIPQTNASNSVQSEVAAAILSGYLSNLSKTSGTLPCAKGKSVKKNTKRSSTSSSALLSKSMTVDVAPDETPNLHMDQGHKHGFPTNPLLPRAPELNGPPCPICLGEPFHIRYRCPTVLKGPDAIRERLEQVKKSDGDNQGSLIKELEDLLRDTEGISEPSLDAAPPREIQPQEASRFLNVPVSRIPNIPGNSNLSEVTVESRDEGSSSESSDDAPEGRNGHDKEKSTLGKQTLAEEQPSPSNDNLKAVVRGPALRRQSILQFLDSVIEDEDDKDSESEETEAELDDDTEENIDRSLSRLSRHTTNSSDSEIEEEGSRSSSPPSPVRDSTGSDIQGSNSPVEGPTEHQDNDGVMRGCVDPPVPRGQDDDSSETHVGSEVHMVVDDLIPEKGTTTVVEEKLSSPRVSVPQLPDALSNEPQQADPAANGGDGTPAAPEVPNETEVDPIEPVDDLENMRMSNVDPIEASPKDIGSMLAGITQSTPKPGVTKRIKTRDGRILEDESGFPVLLEQLASDVTGEVPPLPTKGKSRRRTTEVLAGQTQVSTRRTTRSSSSTAPMRTPADMALLNHKAKIGTRSDKITKMSVKRSQEQTTDASQSCTKVQNEMRIRPTPSLAQWETLAEPSSPPSLRLNEPSVRIDELMSSSPHPEDNHTLGRSDMKKKNTPRTPAISSRAKEKARLFDLSSSQVPFPYSQRKIDPTPTMLINGKDQDTTSDSEGEKRSEVSKRKTKPSTPYRPLSQLASQAALFSASLPTPINKSAPDTRTKKRTAKLDSSSSDEDEDEDEDGANKSEHIPRGRRAGTVLETKKKKSLPS